MLVFCKTSLIYVLYIFLSEKRVNNCLKFKAVKNSCSFSGHQRPLLGNLSKLLNRCGRYRDRSFASVCSYSPLPLKAILRADSALAIFERGVRNGLYEVFKDSDFNDLCKIWQMLYVDGQERVNLRKINVHLHVCDLSLLDEQVAHLLVHLHHSWSRRKIREPLITSSLHFILAVTF